MDYEDCLIIGGGIAGLQSAIQLGRYKHRVTVIDRGYGRLTLCRSYHNILGWPDGVSVEKLRRLGRKQAEQLGVRFVAGEAIHAAAVDSGFEVTLRSSESFRSCKLLLAAGVLDRFLPVPGLESCLGLTIYVCPDCDGYEVSERSGAATWCGTVGKPPYRDQPSQDGDERSRRICRGRCVRACRASDEGDGGRLACSDLDPQSAAWSRLSIIRPM